MAFPLLVLTVIPAPTHLDPMHPERPRRLGSAVRVGGGVLRRFASGDAAGVGG
jgi:hypothetical protein